MIFLEFSVFFCGALIGSFLNVCVFRLPRHKSILFPSSFCPSCSHSIKWLDNVPLISYLVLRGQCRFCKSRIPKSYFCVELTHALLYLLIIKFYMISIIGVVNFSICLVFIFSSLLFLISLIDIKYQVILDKITMLFLLIFLMISSFNPWTKGSLDAALGAFSGGGVLFAVAFLSNLFFNQQGMGGGDIKLACMLGAFLGLEGIMQVLAIAFVVGALFSLLLLVLKIKNKHDAIVFGPFLAMAAFVVMIQESYGFISMPLLQEVR